MFFPDSWTPLDRIMKNDPTAGAVFFCSISLSVYSKEKTLRFLSIFDPTLEHVFSLNVSYVPFSDWSWFSPNGNDFS